MHTYEILKNHAKSMMTNNVWHENNESLISCFQVKGLPYSMREASIPYCEFF
jgi:hypothetical protein